MTIIQKGGKMGRLLDEDDVVDWLLKRTEMYDATGHFVDENVVKKNIESQIAKIPSAQQWIPCSERMPDNDEAVLISHSQGVTKAWWNGRFWTSIAVKKYKTVVAWMPLPEPYKGGRDADR